MGADKFKSLDNNLVSEIPNNQNSNKSINKTPKRAYIESYGCQMNFADSEIVASILIKDGYSVTEKLDEASLILVNTCSIREKAEKTVRK